MSNEYKIKGKRIQEVVDKLKEADACIIIPDILSELMAAQAALMDCILQISEEHHDNIVQDLDDKIEEQSDKIAELEDEVAHTDKTNERMREEITTLENERLERQQNPNGEPV